MGNSDSSIDLPSDYDCDGPSPSGATGGLDSDHIHNHNETGHNPDPAANSPSDIHGAGISNPPLCSLPRDFVDNFKNILGNTEGLSSSAQKLFAMGKIYLSGKDLDISQNEGFPALFRALPQDAEYNTERTANERCDHVKHYSTVTPSVQLQGGEDDRPTPTRMNGIQWAQQTYLQWKAGHDLAKLNYMCFTQPKTIYIQPLDDFPDFVTEFKLHTQHLTLSFFNMLQGFVQIFFSGMEVTILPSASIRERGWKVRSRFHEVTKQEQYCVTDLFPCLQALLPRSGHSIIGVVWTDLYPENFNFVLGEASYTHKSAVISFGRYETTNFDADNHQDVTEMNGQMLWKLMRTLSHEVCHLFGLSHCVFFHCAMNESSSVPQALSQPLFLCPVCLRKLQQACGFDVLQRYQLLLKLIQSINHQYPDSVQLQDSAIWLSNCVDYLTS